MDSNSNTQGDAFSRVLSDEIRLLRPQAHSLGRCPEECADRAKFVGLSLSGGGIRSATFCLGLIQALAHLRLLRGFDYLSTVSGGGYIGAWLSSLIHRSRKPSQSAEDGLAALERELSGDRRSWCADGTPVSDCPPEHPSVRFLRRYSNYLTPKLGLLSGDSLAAVSTYLRNLLLNQLILLAFFGALLTLPYLLLILARWLIDDSGFNALVRTLFPEMPLIYGFVWVPLAIAVAGCARSLMYKGDHFNSTGPVIFVIVIPALASAFLLSLALYAHVDDYTLWQSLIVNTILYSAPWAIVGGVSIALTGVKKVAAVRAAIPWTLLAGALGGVFFHFLRESAVNLREGAMNLPGPDGLVYAVAFGPPLVLLGYSWVVTLHVGLMKQLFSENDREWWARLEGFIMLAALAWTVSFVVTLYASPLVKWLAGLALAGGLAWIASSIGGVLLGKSSLTGPKDKTWLNMAVQVVPYIFIVGLAFVLASVLNAVLTSHTLCGTCVPVFAADHFGPILTSSFFNLDRVDLTAVLRVGGICAAAFALLDRRVDANLFSLHGFYRNRLTRCYLGATRLRLTFPIQVERSAHPFTGFDPKDDLRLSELGDQRPYPIINAAMNLTGGEDLAWQTRRAASFTFTPCHTGFEFWDSTGERIYAYRSTKEYASDPDGGILLGDVVAVSGAAANPNMGYHTSAAVSALMSVFNVRLGRWCGNPRHSSAWRKASPRSGGLALLEEVFGMLTSRSGFLNISDGGHFENLGIYELVRRRCHVVVAVDAGCDPDYQFEDLANAMRKCWTDFGVRIEIDLAALQPHWETKRCRSHFAVGSIHYPDGPLPGVLIYIKASLSGDEPSDVLEYAARHSKFPNESTGDQFFDENQFESYRKLGRHTGLRVFAPLFPPQYDSTQKKRKAAEDTTPQQIRDALAGQALEHPALQPGKKSRRQLGKWIPMWRRASRRTSEFS